MRHPCHLHKENISYLCKRREKSESIACPNIVILNYSPTIMLLIICSFVILYRKKRGVWYYILTVVNPVIGLIAALCLKER